MARMMRTNITVAGGYFDARIRIFGGGIDGIKPVSGEENSLD
jgi:hypothetical protein